MKRVFYIGLSLLFASVVFAAEDTLIDNHLDGAGMAIIRGVTVFESDQSRSRVISATESVTTETLNGIHGNITNVTASELTATNANVTDVTATNLNAGADPGHTHTASSVSGLDAGDTTTGVFSTDRIPDLNASKITSGTVDEDRLPSDRTIANVTFTIAVIVGSATPSNPVDGMVFLNTRRSRQPKTIVLF